MLENFEDENMSDKKLKRVHDRLLKMACIIEKILNKYEIPHSLSSGSLLGAVRHRGFIPWDDDFDFLIFGEYYTRAIMLLRSELPNDFFLEDEKTEPNFFHAWARVKDLKTSVELYHYPKDGIYKHHGLCVDLFRYEKIRLKDHASEIEKQYINYLLRCQKLNIMDDNEVSDRLYKLSESLRLYWDKKLRNETPSSLEREVYASIYTGRNFYEVDDFFPLQKYDFEGELFWGPNNADAILSRCFGNYMELPPKELRIPHYSDIRFEY